MFTTSAGPPSLCCQSNLAETRMHIQPPCAVPTSTELDAAASQRVDTGFSSKSAAVTVSAMMMNNTMSTMLTARWARCGIFRHSAM